MHISNGYYMTSWNESTNLLALELRKSVGMNQLTSKVSHLWKSVNTNCYRLVADENTSIVDGNLSIRMSLFCLKWHIKTTIESHYSCYMLVL